MDSNVELILGFPVPPVDAEALIEGAILDDPASQAARAIVAKLLSDGEMIQYADGRTALYLATEHRPALQVLIDGLPAEMRQRLLEGLTKSIAAPALEGLILGRWPSRGFLVETREIFRLPQFRVHLNAASADFVEKLSAARAMLQDHSPASPARQLLDLLQHVQRDTPRTASGEHVQPAEYAALCRSTTQTLALARDLSKEIQEVSVALFRALRGSSSFYLPRSPGGTGGEGDELNTMDQVDVADYCSFLCCLANELMRADLGDEMTGMACTTVARSVLEALLLAYLQRRFPGLAAPADAEVEGSRPQSAEENEQVNQQVRRKFPLFLQTKSLLASFRESAQGQPTLFVGGQAVRVGPVADYVLDALGRSVQAWTALRMLSDQVYVPRNVTPLPGLETVFLHPLPDLSLLQCLEDYKPNSDRRKPPVRIHHIAGVTCQHRQSTLLGFKHGWSLADEADRVVTASIGIQSPDGGACLTADSYVPVSQFLQPESPASIVAAFMVRQASRDVPCILSLLEAFGVEKQIQEAARDVPRLDFFHVKRKVRRRLFFWWKRVENLIHLVMRRQDAVRLGILRRVRALPPREQELMRKSFGYCPEDPVALRMAISDDDGGGGDEPPPSPAPQPSLALTEPGRVELPVRG